MCLCRIRPLPSGRDVRPKPLAKCCAPLAARNCCLQLSPAPNVSVASRTKGNLSQKKKRSAYLNRTFQLVGQDSNSMKSCWPIQVSGYLNGDTAPSLEHRFQPPSCRTDQFEIRNQSNQSGICIFDATLTSVSLTDTNQPMLRSSSSSPGGLGAGGGGHSDLNAPWAKSWPMW